jgi:hypothetical protein
MVALQSIRVGDQPKENYVRQSLRMQPGRGEWGRRLLGYAWLCALAVALVFSAQTTDRYARQVEEFACFCDPFGYL